MMRPTASKSHEAVMGDKTAELGRWRNRLIAAIGEFLDHGGTVEEAVSLIFRVAAGEAHAEPTIGDNEKPVNVEAHARRAPSKADLEQRAEKFANITKAIFGHKTSDGRDWARVRLYERAGMKRDAALVDELEKELPAVSNEDVEYGEVISKEQFEAARQRAERQTG